MDMFVLECRPNERGAAWVDYTSPTDLVTSRRCGRKYAGIYHNRQWRVINPDTGKVVWEYNPPASGRQ